MLNRGRLGATLEPLVHVRSADPRRRVLDALVRTVARESYERATIERVLELAEVPQPVFAEHFEDKRDCLLAALDDLLARLSRALEQDLDESAPWPERVRAGLRRLLAELAENPDGARVALVECLSAGDPAIARLRHALASCVPLLEEGRDFSAAAEPCGRGGDDDVDRAHLPAQTAEAIAGGIASILHRRALDGRIAELPGLLPDLLYFALMPYLGHRRALAESALAG
jgi:AcrR family transcriptional regulator